MRQSTHCLTAILIASLTACSQEQADTPNTVAIASKTDAASGFSTPSPKPTDSRPSPLPLAPDPVLTEANPSDNNVAARQQDLGEDDLESELQEKADKKSKKDKSDKDHSAKREVRPQLPPMSAGEKKALFEKRAKNEADLQAAARKTIHSENKAERLEAVQDLTPDDAGDLKLLLEALNIDADAEIRAEIAGKLSFGEYPSAVPGLIKALDDPRTEVVLAAIESLSWYDGAEKNSITQALSHLQAHQSTSVRDAAQTTLDSLDTDID